MVQKAQELMGASGPGLFGGNEVKKSSVRGPAEPRLCADVLGVREREGEGKEDARGNVVLPATALRGFVQNQLWKSHVLSQKKTGSGLQSFASQPRLRGQDGVGQLLGDLWTKWH